MRNTIFTFFILLVVLFTSCSKKIVPVVPPSVPSIDIQLIDFEYFHGKARISFKDDKKEREVKANIRIRKDSVIWMNFTVIGVQGGRALINKDSITILSNVEKEYFVFEYAELSRRFNFPINFEIIQAAMLGNLLQPKTMDDKIIHDNTFKVLEQNQNTVHIKNYINAASTKLERVEMTEANSSNSMTINYRNFQPVGDKIFPYDGLISLFYKTISGVLNTSIEFEYNKAEVGDKELKFPFSIPRKYERR